MELPNIYGVVVDDLGVFTSVGQYSVETHATVRRDFNQNPARNTGEDSDASSKECQEEN